MWICWLNGARSVPSAGMYDGGEAQDPGRGSHTAPLGQQAPDVFIMYPTIVNI